MRKEMTKELAGKMRKKTAQWKRCLAVFMAVACLVSTNLSIPVLAKEDRVQENISDFSVAETDITGTDTTGTDTIGTDTTGTDTTETDATGIAETEVTESNASDVLTVSPSNGEECTDASVAFHTTPEDALVFARGEDGRRIYPDEDGNFHFTEASNITVNVTKTGYIGKSLQFVAGGKAEYEITLERVTENTEIDPSIPSVWPSFRGNQNNNGVTKSPVPVTADDAELYWATKCGEGWSEPISSPILVDGYLFAISYKGILKLDTTTGEIVARGDMITTSAYNNAPPVYANGMIFVALKDGYVQAFNAKTLESLWVYQDPLKGQPYSPITYYNGYVYTGFWKGENEANFVALLAADENPTDTKEEKCASWTYSRIGGFYYAGAYVNDHYLVVGTDAGKSGETQLTASVLTMDPVTGEILDELTGFHADVKSSICYDEKTDRYYFTTNEGYFYSVQIGEDGRFIQDSLKELNLSGTSTSTPVVHNGRAYVGVSGKRQFTQYNGHHIAVIDLESFQVAYTCKTQGYPQTSGLLSTAYEETEGYVSVYFMDNMTPGKLRVIKDRPNQTVMEEDDLIQYAPILFTPSGPQAQYAVASPIADEYGTLYFNNDSNYIMAVGSKITETRITREPKKTVYSEGECFEPDGMKVAAVLANGMQKDVTDYVTCVSENLVKETSEVAVTFPYVAYQDQRKDTSAETTDALRDSNESGVVMPKPVTYAEISVLTMNSDDSLENEDYQIKIRTPQSYTYSGKAVTPEAVIYDGNVRLTLGVDYTVTYKNNVNANAGGNIVLKNGMGENYKKELPTMIINGAGKYKDILKTTCVNFNIYRRALSNADITRTAATVKMGGKKVTPKAVCYRNGVLLKEKKAYTILGYVTEAEYQQKKNSEEELRKALKTAISEAGEYRILIEGKGNYRGIAGVSVRVCTSSEYKNIASCKVGKISAIDYTGIETMPSADEIHVYKRKTEVSKDNYEVISLGCTKAGKATFIIRGIREYAGSKTVTFQIKARNIAEDSISVNEIAPVNYTGKNLKPAVVIYDTEVTDAYGEPKRLMEGIDYTVKYQNNKKAALSSDKKKPTVVIKGKGNYQGSRKLYFSIMAASH